MRYRLRTLLIVLTLGPMVLADAADVQPKPPPPPSIYGEWEVVEMIHKGKVQDFKGESGGWFTFEPGAFIRAFDGKERDALIRDKGLRKGLTRPCTIRPRELDIVFKWLGRKEEMLTRAFYEFQDRDLRIIWPVELDTERPTNFEALTNPSVSYFLLKKVK